MQLQYENEKIYKKYKAFLKKKCTSTVKNNIKKIVTSHEIDFILQLFT